MVESGRRPSEWGLDPAAYDDVWALRSSGRLPQRAGWFSSPEPKATETAQLLTDQQVGIIPGLREHVRDSTEWHDDHEALVRQAFATPEVSVHPGWEPLADCRARVTDEVSTLRAAYGSEDLVLIGHGTAWTVLAAVLTGAEPDLDRWAQLAMRDVIVVG